jgi:hypothetical protein
MSWIKNYQEWQINESFSRGTAFTGGMLPGTKKTRTYKVLQAIASAGKNGLSYGELKDYLFDVIEKETGNRPISRGYWDTTLFSAKFGDDNKWSRGAGLLNYYCTKVNGRYVAKPEVIEWFTKHGELIPDPSTKGPTRPVSPEVVDWLATVTPSWRAVGSKSNPLVNSDIIRVIDQDIVEVPIRLGKVENLYILRCPNLKKVYLPKSGYRVFIENCPNLEEVSGDFNQFERLDIINCKWTQQEYEDAAKMSVSPSELSGFNSDWTI